MRKRRENRQNAMVARASLGRIKQTSSVPKLSKVGDQHRGYERSKARENHRGATSSREWNALESSRLDPKSSEGEETTHRSFSEFSRGRRLRNASAPLSGFQTSIDFVHCQLLDSECSDRRTRKLSGPDRTRKPSFFESSRESDGDGRSHHRFSGTQTLP